MNCAAILLLFLVIGVISICHAQMPGFGVNVGGPGGGYGGYNDGYGRYEPPGQMYDPYGPPGRRGRGRGEYGYI